jgi:hypothetical protein
MATDWEYLGEQTLPPGIIEPWRIQTWRSCVPGGWLVLIIKDGGNTANSISSVFYPDASHGWDGHSLSVEEEDLEGTVANDETDEDAPFWALQKFDNQDNEQ